MTVEELIEELQKYDKLAEVITIQAVGLEWKRTTEPEITETENMFGKKVWIN